MFAYDIEKNEFSLEKLCEVLSLSSVHPSLNIFLNKYKNIEDAISDNAHDEWLMLTSNIPYVSYFNRIHIASENISHLSDKTQYISGIHKDIPLDQHKYILTTNESKTYNLFGSVKNIIIILNYLLNLDLFQNAGGLEKVFNDPKFVTTYFPMLCARLDAIGSLSISQYGPIDPPNNIDYDNIDYRHIQFIYSRFELNGIICQFSTHGHGDFELRKADEPKEVTDLNLLLKTTIQDITQPYSLSFLIAKKLFQETIPPKQHLSKNPHFFYSNLFAIPIGNPDQFNIIINRLTKDTAITEIPLNMKIAIKDLLLQRASAFPDQSWLDSFTFSILQYFTWTLNNDEEKGFSSIIPDLTKLTKSRLLFKRTNDITLFFKELIEQNKFSNPIFEFFENTDNIRNLYLIVNSGYFEDLMPLIVSLVRAGHCYSFAKTFADNIYYTSSFSNKYIIYSELVLKGLYIDEGNKLIEKYFNLSKEEQDELKSSYQQLKEALDKMTKKPEEAETESEPDLLEKSSQEVAVEAETKADLLAEEVAPDTTEDRATTATVLQTEPLDVMTKKPEEEEETKAVLPVEEVAPDTPITEDTAAPEAVLQTEALDKMTKKPEEEETKADLPAEEVAPDTPITEDTAAPEAVLQTEPLDVMTKKPEEEETKAVLSIEPSVDSHAPKSSDQNPPLPDQDQNQVPNSNWSNTGMAAVALGATGVVGGTTLVIKVSNLKKRGASTKLATLLVTLRGRKALLVRLERIKPNSPFYTEINQAALILKTHLQDISNLTREDLALLNQALIKTDKTIKQVPVEQTASYR